MIISFANLKGGVGKTTTIVSLCAGMKRRGLKTLLVDMDPQANATMMTGIRGHGMYEMLSGQKDIHEVICHSEKLGDVIPSSLKLGKFLLRRAYELEEGIGEGYEMLLKNQLEKVRDDYDFILIDTPRAAEIELEVKMALVASDSVICLAQTGAFSISGSSDLTRIIAKTRKDFNPGLKTEGVLISNVDKRNSNERNARENYSQYVKEKLGAPFFDFSIRTSADVSKAEDAGESMYDYNRRADIIQDYERLIDTLIERNRK